MFLSLRCFSKCSNLLSSLGGAQIQHTQDVGLRARGVKAMFRPYMVAHVPKRDTSGTAWAVKHSSARNFVSHTLTAPEMGARLGSCSVSRCQFQAQAFYCAGMMCRIFTSIRVSSRDDAWDDRKDKAQLWFWTENGLSISFSDYRGQFDS